MQSQLSIFFYFQEFSRLPKLFISVRHEGRTKRKEAMTFWSENLGSSGFYVCLREMISFSGKHENLYIVSDE